nr:glycosyltransferase family 4 protein [Thermococcus sp. AM4]
MKVTIITPDVSHNCIGRAWVLASILNKSYDVEIVGPRFGNSVWPPLLDMDINIPIKSVGVNKIGYSFPLFYKEIIPLIEGDIVYVSKLHLSSLIPALIANSKLNIPYLVDVDDWELGFVINMLKNKSLLQKPLYYISSSLLWARFSSYWQFYLPDRFAGMFNVPITVSNSFLKRKFGGTIIWHTRDEEKFDPALYDQFESRRKFGIPEDKKVILFFGTPRPYKGVENLILALSMLHRKDSVLVIAGLGEDPYSRFIATLGKEKLGDSFIGLGYIPLSKAPEVVSIADVYVVPQHDSPATLGQMPAKVFDAMAMAKPIVATRVSDLPYVLAGVGRLIYPGDLKGLANEIEFLLDNECYSRKLGIKARRRFVKEFGLSAMSEKMKKLFKREGLL